MPTGRAIPLDQRRGLTKGEAAAYVGLSDERFDRAVSEGIYPATLPGGIWDRDLLDTIAATEPLDRNRVYFIACDKYVKIGYAGRVSFRQRELQCASPYELIVLGTIPGSTADETRLHKHFAHLRVRGEWFHLDPEIEAFIQEHCW